jgi:hypothetical protein
MKREPLPVEMLIPEHQRHSTPKRRRVSIGEHEQFQKHIAASLAAQPDPIDDALGDPIHDHAPAYRSGKAKSRLLGILDQLDREGRK